MKDKTYFAPNGGWAKMTKLFPSGMYLVEVFDRAGSLHDKMRCDTYGGALDYWRSFKKIARNL